MKHFSCAGCGPTLRLVRLQDDTGPVFLEQPVETVVAPSPLFLLWAYDFSMRTDSGFMLEFAAELIALGYRVVMESPSDGALPQRLYPQHAFTARVNPHLQKVLSGHSGAARNAIDAIGESPEFIVCFSSLWAPFFLQMPDKNDLRAIWYFYTPQRCDTSKDACQLESSLLWQELVRVAGCKPNHFGVCVALPLARG